jgi:hypothetical protein
MTVARIESAWGRKVEKAATAPELSSGLIHESQTLNRNRTDKLGKVKADSQILKVQQLV